MVAHLKNVLAMYGIHSVTRNGDLLSAAGELPPTECWPALWITNDEKLVRARSIIRKTLAPLESVKTPWRCAGCGEELEGQFTECWNCGRSRSRSASAAAK
jgi:hypothetical protein